MGSLLFYVIFAKMNNMMIFIYIAIFVFGLCIGSFLNCLTYRLEKAEGLGKGRFQKKSGFFWGRSFCPKCEHKLGVWDLIPVVSFLMLKGKCRYCKKKISFQYPLVEIVTGLLLIFNFQFLISNQFLIFNFQFLIYAFYLLLINCLLIIIFLYDLKHYIILDKIIYPAIGLALIFNFQWFSRLTTSFSISKHFSIFQFSIMSAFAAAAFFFLIWFVSKGKWMGFGDVKLAFFMGLFLGWPNILVALFLAFLIGSFVGIISISLGKKKFKSEVPFGPFLIIGTFIALFWGNEIMSWYLSFIK